MELILVLVFVVLFFSLIWWLKSKSDSYEKAVQENKGGWFKNSIYQGITVWDYRRLNPPSTNALAVFKIVCFITIFEWILNKLNIISTSYLEFMREIVLIGILLIIFNKLFKVRS